MRSYQVKKCPAAGAASSSTVKASVSSSSEGNAPNEANKEKDDIVSNILCGLCDTNKKSMDDLCDHLQKVHKEPLEIKHLTFESESDFDDWKRRVEIEGTLQFVRNGSRKNIAAMVCYYFLSSKRRSGVDIGRKTCTKEVWVCERWFHLLDVCHCAN